jgi:hypothetical protein
MKGYGRTSGWALLALTLTLSTCHAGDWGRLDTQMPGPRLALLSYSYFEDGGATAWNNGRRLIADNRGSLHLAYQEYYRCPGVEDNEIMYCYSEDQGTSWVQWRCHNAYHASLTVDSEGYPQVVRIRWVPFDDWFGELLIFDFLDTDSVWVSKMCGIGSAAGSLERPSICIDAHDRAHIVWAISSGDTSFLYHWQSNWDELQNERILWTPGMKRYQFPSISVDWMDRPHIVYQEGDYSSSSIMHTYRLASGEWTTPVEVSQTYEAHHPCLIRATSHSLQVVFDGDDYLFPGVWHARWSIEENWSDNEEVHRTGDHHTYPVIGERSVIAWHANGEIWTTRGHYDPGLGYSFPPPINISQTPAPSSFPQVAVGCTHVFYAWTEEEDPPRYRVEVKKIPFAELPKK